MDLTMERISEELQKQNKQQNELAEHLGVTGNVITDWKSGRLKSYKKYIHGIAAFLGVSVEYLKGETDIKENPTADGDEALMFALWGGDTANVTPEMLSKVKEFARFVQEEERRKKNDTN